jgi:hypothetical protein
MHPPDRIIAMARLPKILFVLVLIVVFLLCVMIIVMNWEKAPARDSILAPYYVCPSAGLTWETLGTGGTFLLEANLDLVLVRILAGTRADLFISVTPILIPLAFNPGAQFLKVLDLSAIAG